MLTTVPESGALESRGCTLVTRPSAGETIISESEGIVLSGSRKKYNMNAVKTRNAATAGQIEKIARTTVSMIGTAMNGIPSFAIGNKHLEAVIVLSTQRRVGARYKYVAPQFLFISF